MRCFTFASDANCLRKVGLILQVKLCLFQFAVVVFLNYREKDEFVDAETLLLNKFDRFPESNWSAQSRDSNLPS